MIILASVFLLMVAIGIILLVLIYQKKQIIYKKEKEQLRIDFENQILESKLEIQEQTLKNISQEIHDNIGQVLSLAKLTLGTLYPNGEKEMREKVENARELVGKAIIDLRNLSKSLNPDYITELGLERSVEYELELLEKASVFKIEKTVTGNPYPLDHKQQLILFRIFQEILQNIIKHSGAETIGVHFNYDPGFFEFTIRDDGQGFDQPAIAASSKISGQGGIGLKNMEHRAKLISASFSIESSPGSGTSVRIRLPLQS